MIDGEAVRRSKANIFQVRPSIDPVASERQSSSPAAETQRTAAAEQAAATRSRHEVQPAAATTSQTQPIKANHQQAAHRPAAGKQSLALEPVQASPQLLDASREVSNAGRELAGLGQAMLAATPKQGQEGAEQEGGSLPALSNYYGDVTVNYYVSPGGIQQGPTKQAGTRQGLSRVNHQEEVAGILDPSSGIPYAPPCTACGVVDCCPKSKCHCLGFFAQAMYLRPGNADIVYATEQLGCEPEFATPTGPEGLIAPDAEAGFRTGIIIPLSSCSSIVASYTWFQSDTNSYIVAQDIPDAVLSFNVGHPAFENCGANSRVSSAKYDLDFELVDLAYRRELWGSCASSINWSAGVRYGRLEQEFIARQEIGSAAGLATVLTDVDFDGLGVRLGLDGERISSRTGLFIYGSGAASFLGGNYRADYVQINQFGAGTNISVSREDYRLTTILEAELGVGWQSPKGHVRLTAGYMVMGWHNTLRTNSFLSEVTSGAPLEDDDFLTFDGLVAGFELRL
ncbi:MAG: hypothetical protein J5I93_25875 [Pirellulaceae bacterium]|nr:hypothetical protein [Pirellulaceae bacterium]